jgi:colanic acid/amylovoran biosynthesis glycosyltransferase
MPTPIGFLRHNFLPRSETFVYNSMRGLEDGGRYSVRVLALERFLADRFPWSDVTLLRRKLRYYITRSTPAFVEWARSVRLIHAHLGQTGPFAMAGAKRAGIPFVVSYYGQDVAMYRTSERFRPYAWHYMFGRRRMLAAASKVLVLSQHMKRALVAQGCDESKLEIVRLGIDLARFDIQRTPPRAMLRILMIGREVDKKGFDDGMRACRLLQDRGIATQLTLLGTDGPLKPMLQALDRELGLQVAWPAPTTPVTEAMANADILLVPSRTAANGDEEGTPTVIVEGGAARLPVVSTRHAGIPEQVVEGETGYLTDERDVPALADAIARLIDPARRLAMGEAARTKMQGEYSLAAHCARLEEVYGSILARSERKLSVT